MRVAVDRRGELGLTQHELAERAGVSIRTIVNFENGHSWPYAQTLGQVERLGLNWPVGYLREIAADHDDEQRPSVGRVVSKGMSYPSRERAARIKELEERIARDQRELDELLQD